MRNDRLIWFALGAAVSGFLFLFFITFVYSANQIGRYRLYKVGMRGDLPIEILVDTATGGYRYDNLLGGFPNLAAGDMVFADDLFGEESYAHHLVDMDKKH